jgi:phage gp46-like protein
MDTALKNGDFARNANGRPGLIDGIQEILQRAAIRLTVPLGEFVYDAQLGSRLHSLNPLDDTKNAKALAMAQEALKSLPQLTVESVACSDENPMRAVVAVSCAGRKAEIEVNL